MDTMDKIKRAVYDSIDEINNKLSGERKLEKSPETILIGKKGKLDSLGFINFIVALEDCIEKEFGLRLTLSNDSNTFIEQGPLQTVTTLNEYLFLLITKSQG